MHTHDINEALKSNYLLLTLSISMWNASRPDKQLAVEVATQHGATPEAVATTRRIMAGADSELNAVKKALNAIRTYIYSQTIPWSSAGDESARRGPRLLPTTKSLDVIKTLKSLNDEYQVAMNDFIKVYDQRVAQALTNQGSLADPTQYPGKDDIRAMFDVRLDMQPVPTVSDFSRMNIPAQLADVLGNRMGTRQAKVVENAMRDLVERTVTVVSNMATQLNKHAQGEKTRLFKSLVENVRTMTELLQSSNLTNDPKLDAIAKQMEEICVYDIEQLRSSPDAAKKIAGKAERIVRDLTADAQSLDDKVTRIVKQEATPQVVKQDTIDIDQVINGVFY